MLSTSSDNNRLFWMICAPVLFLKLVMLGLYGPLILPDSEGYAGFANTILTQRDWIWTLNWEDSWRPATGFRTIGYAALIAAIQLVFGDYWSWALIIVQIAVSMVTAALIWRFCCQLFTPAWLAVAGLLLYWFSQGIFLDQAVLTDSLNANLVMIAVLIIVTGLVSRQKPAMWHMLIAGGCLALAFLIREAGHFLQILIWPALVLWLVQARPGWGRAAMLVIAFILPMQVMYQGYSGWNQMRSGERFITTAGQTTMFFPMFGLMEEGYDALDHNPIYADMPAFEKPLDMNSMSNVYVLNKHLRDKYDMTPVDISRQAFSTFFDLWQRYPLAMLKVTLSEIREKQAQNFFMPFEGLMTTDFWATGSKPISKFKHIWADGRYDLVVMHVLRNIERVISLIIAIAFVFAIPVSAIRQLIRHRFNFYEIPPAVQVAGYLWLLYFGFTFAYALVHMEQRYLQPVSCLAALAGLYMLADPLQRLARRFSRHRQNG